MSEAKPCRLVNCHDGKVYGLGYEVTPCLECAKTRPAPHAPSEAVILTKEERDLLRPGGVVLVDSRTVRVLIDLCRRLSAPNSEEALKVAAWEARNAYFSSAPKKSNEERLKAAMWKLADILHRGHDSAPVPMVLYCPRGHHHIDEGEWATKPHKTHRCTGRVMTQAADEFFPAEYADCGLEWRPADFPTVGVEKL